ncbi:hypothetical protein OG339_48235 (plasmid) [Streptosporangium sp. NBC_01495]|uniref:hypothetical protein n=1 Tax=Streptosporangium sp. NBC_01495 TaxID=2903899 RepID=UPI002E32B80D|nr:hypothetical protein [Streptosporangium sp. NBC_01495]
MAMIFQYCIEVPTRTEIEVSKTAGQKAIQGIILRRTKAGDPGVDRLLDDELAENPLPVIHHLFQQMRVRAHSITDDDVIDALRVLGYIRTHLDHRPAAVDHLEHELLELGRALQVPLIRLAEPLGLRSAQAVDHRIRRGRAAKQGLPRNERIERAHRLDPAQSETTKRREAQWYGRHALKLYDAAGKLILLRRQYDALIDDALAEQIVDLARTHREMAWPLTPDSFPTLRWMATTMAGIVEDLEGGYGEFRAKAGDLLPEMSQLVRSQQAARFDS